MSFCNISILSPGVNLINDLSFKTTILASNLNWAIYLRYLRLHQPFWSGYFCWLSIIQYLALMPIVSWWLFSSAHLSIFLNIKTMTHIKLLNRLERIIDFHIDVLLFKIFCIASEWIISHYSWPISVSQNQYHNAYEHYIWDTRVVVLFRGVRWYTGETTITIIEI